MATGKRVLFLTRLFCPHVGGVEKHVFELAQQCIRRGWKVTVITQEDDPAELTDEVWNDIRILRIPQKLTKNKMTIWFWMLMHISQILSADIVHAHDVFWWYLPLRFLLPWKKVYVTFHGYEGNKKPTEKAIRSRKVSELLSFGNICVGAWIQKWYGTHPTAITYGAACAKPAQIPEKYTAVFIGRLEEDTGALEYVQGIKLLGGKVSLDLYGEGSLLGKIEEYKKGLSYIRYCGVAKNPEEVLAKCHFACVSQYLSMIEAMQVGRYVFAQWNSAIKRDYLESFPAIAHVSTFSFPEQLAEEFSYIMTHPEKEKASVREASLWARQQTWDRIADMYERIWNTL